MNLRHKAFSLAFSRQHFDINVNDLKKNKYFFVFREEALKAVS